jgi:hypothetical protein
VRPFFLPDRGGVALAGWSEVVGDPVALLGRTRRGRYVRVAPAPGERWLFVIDVHRGMAEPLGGLGPRPDRLPAALAAARRIAAAIPPEVPVGLATTGGESCAQGLTLRLEPTIDRNRWRREIERLETWRPQGKLPLGGTLHTIARWIDQAPVPRRHRDHVVLLTAGRATPDVCAPALGCRATHALAAGRRGAVAWPAEASLSVVALAPGSGLEPVARSAGGRLYRAPTATRLDVAVLALALPQLARTYGLALAFLAAATLLGAALARGARRG